MAQSQRDPGGESKISALDRLAALGPAAPLLVGSSGRKSRTSDMHEGRFTIFGKETRLVSPVDWNQDPHANRSWRYELHTLIWLKPLLLAYDEESDPESLALACNFLLDWARCHLEPTPAQSEFAWYDMAVGLRAPYVAYVLRQALAEKALDQDDALLLLRTAERHGAELADNDNYAAGHNHGLFQDEGLYLLARQLPTLPQVDDWKRLATNRLRATLEQTISFADGAHLEHSSAYQFSITSLVSRLAENIPEMSELEDLHCRLRETAAWHVTPAGRLAQLGDTDDVPAPKWACQAASKLHGMKVLYEAGQAFVRDGDSYLAVTAAHHSSAHKHADDTGFILVENGVTVLGDTGRWGYYEDEPERVYARSAQAHNALIVDGHGFAWRTTAPYGSGLMDASEQDGWYAILMKNPNLESHGLVHKRLLMYKPAATLIIVDDVQSGKEHCIERMFHFGPQLAAQLSGRGRVSLTGSRIAGSLTSLTETSPDIALSRRIHSPARLGWTYPNDRKQLPVWTATLRNYATCARFAIAVHIR